MAGLLDFAQAASNEAAGAVSAPIDLIGWLLRKAGLDIKLNAVALKGVNDGEIEDLMKFAHGNGYDLTLIETMPLGDIEGDRTDQYLPLSMVRADLAIVDPQELVL